MKRLAIALLVLVALSACVGDLPTDPEEPVDTPADEPPTPPAAQGPQVTVTHASGAWTYAVEADVPSSCHALAAEESVAESYPEQVSVLLTTTEPSPDEICSQVVSRSAVEGSVPASEYASVTITLDGDVIYEREAQEPPQPPAEDLACPAVYQPVCGQPPMPPCPEGFGCPLVMPEPRTYGNGCELNRAGAEFLYEGACDAQGPGDGPECTAVYDPVCGQPPMPECPPGFACPDVMPQPQTYGNECEMLREGATLLYEGACNDLVMS